MGAGRSGATRDRPRFARHINGDDTRGGFNHLRRRDSRVRGRRLRHFAQKLRSRKTAKMRAVQARLDLHEQIGLLAREMMNDVPVRQPGQHIGPGIIARHARLAAKAEGRFLHIHFIGRAGRLYRRRGRKRRGPRLRLDVGSSLDRNALRDAEKFENVFTIEFPIVGLVALPEAERKLRRTFVVSDRDEHLFSIRQRRLVRPALSLHCLLQLFNALRQAGGKVLPLFLQEIIRIRFVELEVVLKDAEAVAEFIGIAHRAGVTANVLRHVHQRLPGDAEHLGAARRAEQMVLRLREGAAAAVGIERVAHTKAENVLFGQAFIDQRAPDISCLLLRDGREHIHAKRRVAHARGDAIVKGLLKPGDGFSCCHGIGGLRGWLTKTKWRFRGRGRLRESLASQRWDRGGASARVRSNSELAALKLFSPPCRKCPSH